MAVSSLRLLDLPWEQVLCKHLLPCLPLKDLFRLRCVSQEFRNLVDCHFSLAFTVNTTLCAVTFSRIAFDVLTRRNCCLKELVLCNSRDWLSDEALIAVLQSNNNLRSVNLSNCLSLSNSALYTVGAHCPNLRVLCLRGCVWVSSSGLLSLITNSLPIEHIDLCGCWDLNDDDIINLAMHCREIKYLLLNNIYGLTDRAIGLAVRMLPGLIQLSVQGCWRLTDQSIHMLGEFCPDLKALQVRECQKVTEASLGKLRARKVRIDKATPPAGGLLLKRLNLQI